jgi:hypothetical protein
MSEPVQNRALDLHRAALAGNYFAAAPTQAAAGRTRADLAKFDEKDPMVRRDWFERSSEEADYGRTALRNLSARLQSIAEAAQAREAAARVGVTEPDGGSAEPATAAAGPTVVSAWGGAADRVTPAATVPAAAPAPADSGSEEPTPPPTEEPAPPPAEEPTPPPTEEPTPPPAEEPTPPPAEEPMPPGQKKKLLGLL